MADSSDSNGGNRDLSGIDAGQSGSPVGAASLSVPGAPIADSGFAAHDQAQANEPPPGVSLVDVKSAPLLPRNLMPQSLGTFAGSNLKESVAVVVRVFANWATESADRFQRLEGVVERYQQRDEEKSEALTEARLELAQLKQEKKDRASERWVLAVEIMAVPVLGGLAWEALGEGHVKVGVMLGVLAALLLIAAGFRGLR